MVKFFANPYVRLALSLADLVFSFVGVPFLILWSLNVVFGLGVAYTVKTFVGAWVLKALIATYIKPKALQVVSLDPRSLGL